MGVKLVSAAQIVEYRKLRRAGHSLIEAARRAGFSQSYAVRLERQAAES